MPVAMDKYWRYISLRCLNIFVTAVTWINVMQEVSLRLVSYMCKYFTWTYRKSCNNSLSFFVLLGAILLPWKQRSRVYKNIWNDWKKHSVTSNQTHLTKQKTLRGPNTSNYHFFFNPYLSEIYCFVQCIISALFYKTIFSCFLISSGAALSIN